MIRKKFFPWLAGVLASGLLAGLASAAELRDIRLSVSPGATQVVLHLSRITEHELFTLEKPDRVVVDLRSTSLADGVRVPEGSGIIDVIRTGVHIGGTLRVVLQLKSPASARASWAEPVSGTGQRLIIDLNDSGPAGESSMLRPVRAAHAPADSNRDVIVAIDAGHGGQDPGAIGRGGTREKDVVLAVARALASRIDAEPGMRAVLTRNKDEFLSLRERIRRARAAKADMFVSIHADSIPNRSVSGASVYVLSERGATDEAARWLAERENAADLMGGVPLSDKDDTLASVLLDLSQSASISASMTAAERVLQALREVGEVRKPRVQQAGFVVLKSPDIPSMLIETAYISNPAEESRLRTRKHQKRLAEAIFTGIRSYFDQHPPPGTRFALARRNAAPGVLAAPATP